jgi:eukaryotic-like serine/threonine-protein kinase
MAPEQPDPARTNTETDPSPPPPETLTRLPPGAADGARAAALRPGGPRYTAIRLHAKGGLGEVHVAQDTELRRTVALKRLQDLHAGRAASVQRFLREAEITAHLEHPGIVPVYGLVHDADGRPAYAMRFVEGDSLRQAADRYHAAPPDRLAFRQLLGHFVAACNAVAYAHSRGVLHRDLKPSNILLGQFGETLVVDWGLAKVVGPADPAPADAEAEATVVQQPAGDATTIGRAAGTPGFMSPEQAAGRWDRVGPASDVYSLGATLYYLLTGHAPFKGTDTPDVLDKVQHGVFLPPRQVRPGVPAALDAVCRRAMAREAADRYATARELAAEVERWLADEPVSAYRDPLTARLARWSRRHRAGVVGAAVLGLAALLGLAVFAWQEEQARRRLQQEQQDTEAARQQAMVFEKQARDAVRQHFVTVTEDPEWKAVGVEPLRKRLLEQARDYFRDFVRQRGGTAGLESELAEAHLRLGLVVAEIGDKEEAVAELRQAADLYQQLADESPDAAEHRNQLAAARNNLGALYRQTGRPREAEAAFQSAGAAWRQLADKYPDVAAYRRELAATHNHLALVYGETGRPKEAEAKFHEVLAVRRKLADENPGVAEYRRHLGASHLGLGNLLHRAGRPKEAEAAYQQALAVRQQLADEHAGVAEYRRDLAAVQEALAFLYRDMGRRAEAEAAHQQALALWQRLADEHPTVTQYQRGLGACLVSLGALYRTTGRPKEAEEAIGRGLALWEKLAEKQPRLPESRRGLADAHYNLGVLYGETDRPKQAEAAFQKSVALWRGLTEEEPAVSQFRRHLGITLANLGVLYSRTRRPREAEAALKQALDQWEKLLAEQPYLADYLRHAADAYAHLGTVYTGTGQTAEAEAALQRALALQQQLADGQPGVSLYAALVGRTFYLLGQCQRAANRPEPALAWYARAVAALEKLVKATGTHPAARDSLRDTFAGRARALDGWRRHAEAAADWERALALAAGPRRDGFRLERAVSLVRAGDHEKALAEVEDVLQAGPKPGMVLYDAACVYAVAAGGVEEGPLAERYADRAIELLRQAAAKGFRDAAHMRQDNDLDALRGRDDFRALLAELEPPKK